MPKIEMFFDHTCPFCYRGHKLLMGLLPKYPDAEIVWRPVEAHPKAEEPWHRPYADLAVQGALYMHGAGLDERAFHERMYKAVFDERLNAEDPAVLTRCAGDTGADMGAFAGALNGARYADAQRAANDYAYNEKDVWAVPTFVCGEKRLDAAEGVGVTREGLDAFLADCCG